MKSIFKIYKTDLKRIFKSKVALVTVIVLCIIPSLYAWINIKACWDPYSNTGNLPVAVVNNDRGCAIMGKEINVGEEVIESLKDNKSINWVFVDEWQGNYGVNEGQYYALIEIPSDFSSSLSTLVTLNPKKPDIIYKSNEKANAIASKITAVAKDKLTKEITTNFVESLNKEAMNFLNSLGGDLQTNKSELLQIKDAFTNTNNNLNKTIEFMNNASKDAASLQGFLYEMQNNLPIVNDQITALQGATSASKDLIRETQSTLNAIVTDLKNNLIEAQVTNGRITSDITRLKVNKNDKESLDDLKTNLRKVISSSENAIRYGEFLNSIGITEGSNSIIGKGKENKSLAEKSLSLAEGSITDETLNNVENNQKKISSNLIEMANAFYNITIQKINIKSQALIAKGDTINKVLEGTRILLPQLNALNNFGIATAGIAGKQADETIVKLQDFQNKLNELKDKTSGVNEEGLNNIIALMEKDPEGVSNFIASPIKVKEEEVYKGGVFGVGVTPFYTVLAIWVGALLTTSILSAEYRREKEEKKMDLVHCHFGKMGLFLTISLIQGVIVCAGDIWILGVEPENIGAFFLMSIITSIVFTFITFTLASVLGNVGKAIAVVFMVLQIAGAGGLYPIQTNPKLFQIINPFLPFTYAISAFRETIGGIEMTNFLRDIGMFLLLGFVFFLLVFLKKPLHKLIEWFEEKFKEAEI
ncbi:MAG: YhgE/Pip family protein [Clostridium sp.]